MIIDWPILSVLTFLPLLGVGFLLLIQGSPEIVARNARFVALWTSLAVLGLAIYLWQKFDPNKAGFQFVENMAWIPSLGLNYHLGIDGISLSFIMLSAILLPLCILASWQSVQSRVKEYMIAFLVLETLMIGTFAALDLFVFYIFFEAVLIPMFLIIGIWGGERRIYASFKFFLYTLLGSVLMLLAMIYMLHQAGESSIPALMNYDFSLDVQKYLWLAFFASFAVKMPMWPVHTWLPDAHVEAPTAGSVILAGVLLKMGGYGFLRFSLPMFPDASAYFADFVYALSLIAIIYTSFVALVQEDMKKLIAYSSVAHMGFVTLGLFSMNEMAVQGAVFQMISHGFISAALFLCVGVVYDRMHTREIARYGGLAGRMPHYALFFMLFTMGGVGLPGTSGFVGEFLVLVGSYQVNSWLAILAATGVILSAAYSLWLYRRVVFGKLVREELKTMADLSSRESLIFWPLAIAVLFLGIYPSFVIDILKQPVAALLLRF